MSGQTASVEEYARLQAEVQEQAATAIEDLLSRLGRVEAQRDALADALEAYVRRGRAALSAPSMSGADPSPDLLAAEAALRAAGRLP